MPKCDQCDHSSANPESLKTHKRDYHVDTVYCGESLTPITRNEKGFACPICLKNNKVTRTFFTHLKTHGLNASLKKKRKLGELDSVDEHFVGEEEADEDTDQHQHPAGEEVVDDEKTCKNGFVQLPPSSSTLAVQPTTELSHLTHSDVILTTTNSLTADKATQEDKMMLAKLGRWVPVVYDHDNMQYGMLTSSSIASILLSKNQTAGTWRSPTSDNNHSSKEVIEIDTSNFIRHLKTTSKASKKLMGTLHEEITGEMVDLLNRDWLEYPQMRYCTSQLLSGAILIEGLTAIIINAVEPYSRDTLLDAHHERRLFGTATSFPSKPKKYGFLQICQLLTPDGLKLTIGSRTCNFLVTSSLRLDIISVNLGPSTTHFVPSQNTKLFLDVSSIDACKSKMSSPTLSRSQLMPSLYLLRQLRSKFDHLSTYTMCRSVSTIASQLELQPCTIWTLSDQESSQPSISQEKIGSLLFREIATQVVKDGENAVLELKALLKLITMTKKDSTVEKILSKIHLLFKDKDQITIIGNTLLNSQLTDLANVIKNKQENKKKIEDISKALYD